MLAIQGKALFDEIEVKLSIDQRKKRRVLLVDDHPFVRRALKLVIEHEGDLMVCGEAEDCGEALALVEALSPALAIVDLSLKTSDGMELVKEVRKRHPQILTIVLSGYNEVIHAERAIRAGANGYVSKQDEPAKLLEAIRKVLAGGIHWPEKAAEAAVNRLTGRSLKQSPEIAVCLSERELQVFELIGTGSNPAQIAEIMDVEVSTVDTYRSRIKEKLSLKGANELRQEAIRWNVVKNAR